MSINFPNNPTVGQEYTANSKTWKWNGTTWNAVVLLEFADLNNKPTTLSGYGITDGVINTRTINGFNLQSNVTLTNDDIDTNTTTISSNTTLALANKGRIIRCTNGSAITITIPLNSSVAFPINTEIAIIREGAGTVSIAPASGVTLVSTDTKRKIKGQYASVALLKTGTDTWVMVGSIEL